MTNEERKQPLVWVEEFHKFVTKADLSEGVDVYPRFLIENKEKEKEVLAQDIACFIAQFMLFTHPRLNGFSGMDTIKWKFHKYGEK
jgi:hypothetical protein